MPQDTAGQDTSVTTDQLRKLESQRRRPEGISALLLPFDLTGAIDWNAYRLQLRRTVDHKLTPAVNMDTGYVNLLSPEQRAEVLRSTADTLAGTPFVAGAFVADGPGAAFDADGYRACIGEIESAGGTPVVFQSHGLTAGSDDEILGRYRVLAAGCDRFIGFELGQAFAPFGRIYSLELYHALMAIPQCVGAKHSSLDRVPEWRRLLLRDRLRPDFRVYTGNDLAIDMIRYGSDWLLGLSTFAPEAFALRDRLFAAGDGRWQAVNDVLQYLGQFTFRRPTPAYKHSAAQFQHLRGWIASDRTHPGSPRRPPEDRAVLAAILDQLEEACG